MANKVISYEISEGMYRHLKYILFVRRYGREVFNSIFKHLYTSSSITIYESLRDFPILCEIYLKVYNIVLCKPEDDKLKELMKEIIRRISLRYEYLEKSFAPMDLENEIRNFRFLLGELMEEAKRVLTEKRQDCDRVSKIFDMQLKCVDISINGIMKKNESERSAELEDFELLQKLNIRLMNPYTTRDYAIRKLVREQIANSRSSWLDMNGTTRMHEIYDNCRDMQQTITVNALKMEYVDQYEILRFQNRSKNPDITVVSGDDENENNKSLLSIVKNFDETVTKRRHVRSVELTGNLRYDEQINELLSRSEKKMYSEMDNVSHLSLYDNLFYLPMKYSNNFKTFDEYLESLIPQICERNEWFGMRIFRDKMKASIFDSKCLVLCDGFDETTENSRRLFNDMYISKRNDCIDWGEVKNYLKKRCKCLQNRGSEHCRYDVVIKDKRKKDWLFIVSTRTNDATRSLLNVMM